MFNYIEKFLEFTAEAESPTSFFEWSGIATLSAIMKDNLYFDTGFDKIYPNIYVLLIAKSGQCRKGTPLKVMKSLITSVGTVRLVAGRATVQAIVKELGSTGTSSSGALITGANALLYSEELSAFFHDDPETIPLLTDLYDSHDTWADSTVGAGRRELKDVCISLIGASNEVLLRDVFTSQALYGGLLARTFVVMESKRRHKDSRMGVNLKNLQNLKTELKQHLVRLANIKGLIKFSADAIKEYDEWYYSIDDDKYTSKSGVEARMHTSVLKLAICLAAAEEEFFRDLTVQTRHVSKAIDMMLSLLHNYDILTMGSGKSVVAEPMTTVIRCLLKAKNNELSRKSLLRMNFGDLDVETLDKSMLTLEQSGAAKSISVLGEPGYKLTEKFVLTLEKNRHKEKSDGGTAPIVN